MRPTLIPALISLFLAIPAAAQAPAATVADQCSDDDGTDRCAPEQRRRVRALFGVKSIEEHQAAGDQVRRAFYVDGYGNDVIAIAFVRSPGREPTLWVHFPRKKGEAAAKPLSAPVPKQVWEHVLARSWLFDRALLPRPGQELICMHAWVYTIEATDPRLTGEYSVVEPPRTKTGDACEGDLVQDYATELARAALPLLPHCAALDPLQHRNEPSQLAACEILQGDRLAAAEVLNRATALDRVRPSGGADALRNFFGHDSTVDWNGERSQGDSSAGFWAAKLAQNDHSHMFVGRVEGLTAQRVRVVGRLSRSGIAGKRDVSQHMAKVEQIWTFSPSREYQIESVKVGPFEPERSR